MRLQKTRAGARHHGTHGPADPSYKPCSPHITSPKVGSAVIVSEKATTRPAETGRVNPASTTRSLVTEAQPYTEQHGDDEDTDARARSAAGRRAR